jgi:FlaA1/EpsC-like NDP-sugar epimerase
MKSLTSRFKAKRRDGLLLAVFYAVVGILQLATLAIIDIRMMWIGALAILSLIAACGLFTAKKWAVWLVIGLFFPQAVFGASTLYGVISLYSSSAELIPLIMEVSLGAFLVLSLVSFLYVAAKRNTFET